MPKPPSTSKKRASTVARTLPPEDIAPGDYVAIATRTGQYLDDEGTTGVPTRLRMLRFAYIPCDAGTPRRVVAVCLPFVTTRLPSGKHEVIDLRLADLFRLDRKAAKAATAALGNRPRKPRK